ncbi:hypothetical protein [Streptomyces sp. NBC_01304]|uniref:hypothetical protein n=1 Tax=Streptomyces sp. NBC_01304 TaxID=2903818 RepID=UPI002E0D24B7|nr:hypothetical protein OG430_13255 [Streptomyces sp. NBC_01304]
MSLVTGGWLAEDLTHRTSHGCKWLAVPWTNYATAYLALGAAVLAIVLSWRVTKAKRESTHWSVPLCLAVSTLLMAAGAFLVYVAHDDAAKVAGKVGQTFCM